MNDGKRHEFELKAKNLSETVREYPKIIEKKGWLDWKRITCERKGNPSGEYAKEER